MDLKKASLTAMLFAAPMHHVFAVGIVNSALNTAVAETGLSDSNLLDIILTGIQVVLGLLAIIVLVLIVYAGVLWMTAGGSEEKVQKAQNIIKNAIIGLLIIMASWGIVLYISNVLGDATGTTVN